MKRKALFFGINYHLETSHVGDASLHNGFTSYSEKICYQISKNYNLTICTDCPNPSLFPATSNLFNIFDNDINDNKIFDAKWKNIFSQLDAYGNNFFSRDTFFRLFKLVSSLNIEKFNNIRKEFTNELIFFNRHEFAFLHEFFDTKNKILIAHDSSFLRKSNFEINLNNIQPLKLFEKAIEDNIVSNMSDIICLSSNEKKYFSSIYTNNKEIKVFSPSVTMPQKIVSLVGKTKLNLYFLGVNNSINVQTIVNIVNIFDKLNNFGVEIEFHIIGSICDSPLVKSFNSSKLTKHGYVNDLQSILFSMDIMIAPITFGSGAPLKIADALNAGHYIYTSELAANPYKEFVGTRIFTDKDPLLSISKMYKNSYRSNSIESYRNYIKQNNYNVSNI